MIVLYHGTTLRLEQPLACVGREDLDFGKGFYLTRLRDQAERWAIRVQLIRLSSDAWINMYGFDLEAALNAGAKMLSFEAYDRHWLDFIVASRNGEKPWIGYDIIEGGVVDDRVIDTVEDYISGNITVDQALGKLRYTSPNNQICILSQSLLDKYLRFVDSERLNDIRGGRPV